MPTMLFSYPVFIVFFDINIINKFKENFDINANHVKNRRLTCTYNMQSYEQILT
jgi:hypothetical protein